MGFPGDFDFRAEFDFVRQPEIEPDIEGMALVAVVIGFVAKQRMLLPQLAEPGKVIHPLHQTGIIFVF
jgi:hypothetical protein